jgi:hypothetical protein
MPRKRKVKNQKAIFDELARKTSKELPVAGFVINPKGEISMSDAVSQLIEPYKKEVPDYSGFSKLVSLACIAWNTSILPQEKQGEALDKMVAILPGTHETRLEMLGLMMELVNRKKKLFPDVFRMIVEFKVTDQGGNFHIAVASTLKKKDTEG